MIMFYELQIIDGDENYWLHTTCLTIFRLRGTMIVEANISMDEICIDVRDDIYVLKTQNVLWL